MGKKTEKKIREELISKYEEIKIIKGYFLELKDISF